MGRCICLLILVAIVIYVPIQIWIFNPMIALSTSEASWQSKYLVDIDWVDVVCPGDYSILNGEDVQRNILQTKCHLDAFSALHKIQIRNRRSMQMNDCYLQSISFDSLKKLVDSNSNVSATVVTGNLPEELGGFSFLGSKIAVVKESVMKKRNEHIGS